jgi:hypothetical protein
MEFLLKPEFETAPNVKILINIGALMDIPTGYYLTGKYGESILNGGLGLLTGVVGTGNLFKSTVMHYMVLSAMDKIYTTVQTSLSTYDTEVNIHEEALKRFTNRFNSFKDIDIFATGIWNISDKTIYYANQWYELLKKFLKNKKEHTSKILRNTPFLTRDGKTLMQIRIPTFSEVDSFSEFETEDIAKIQNDNELGEAGGNTIHMRQGLAKTRFLMELPATTMAMDHFLLLTAHVGKDITMASGPIPQAPIRKLVHLKNGDKIKGVTDKFFFLMSNCWQSINATPLIKQDTKTVEYPRNSNDNKTMDLDLNIVTLRQLRGKAGPSGTVIELVVSQKEGVLPSLTEFHYIKSMDRFGLSGSLQNYNLDLLPDVKLSRTTIRGKIDEMPEVCRALNITAELCQLHQYQRHTHILCKPLELYNDLKTMGYDWNVLLNTRGWWTLDNDKHKIPFLSTLDLLNMRQGTYKPYWMNKNE